MFHEIYLILILFKLTEIWKIDGRHMAQKSKLKQHLFSIIDFDPVQLIIASEMPVPTNNSRFSIGLRNIQQEIQFYYQKSW